MQTTTVFKNGGGQAVRIPRELRFDDAEVYIRRVPEGVLLIPKARYVRQLWAEWAEKLAQYDEPLSVICNGRPQQREKFNMLFP